MTCDDYPLDSAITYGYKGPADTSIQTTMPSWITAGTDAEKKITLNPVTQSPLAANANLMGTHYIYRKAVTANHEVTGTNLEADGSGYYKVLTIKIYCKTTGTNDFTYTAGSFLPATSLYGWVQDPQMLLTQDLSFVYTLCGTTPSLKGSSIPSWKVLQKTAPTAQLTISAAADSAGTSEQTFNAANTVATFAQTALPYLKIVSTNSLSMSAAGITKIF